MKSLIKRETNLRTPSNNALSLGCATYFHALLRNPHFCSGCLAFIQCIFRLIMASLKTGMFDTLCRMLNLLSLQRSFTLNCESIRLTWNPGVARPTIGLEIALCIETQGQHWYLTVYTDALCFEIYLD